MAWLAFCVGTLYSVTIENVVLRGLHRCAINQARPGIAIPSSDLANIADSVGGSHIAEQALKRLVQAGRAVRVRRDLVVLPDAAGLIGVEFLQLLDVVAPNPYLITAGAALQHADLTDQHYFTFSALVPTDTAELRFRGSSAKFFSVDASNLWGWEGEGSTSTRGRRVGQSHFATPERALVDAINHPRYGMSLTQVSNALLRAVDNDRRFLRKLHAAVVRYGAGSLAHGARAAARRTGFIVEQLFSASAAEPYHALVGENRAPVLLRPGLSRKGAVNRKWRLVINARIDPEPTT